jgi:CheY-like chemotaxis protein
LVRLAVGKVLRRAGHVVEEATNGDEALARITIQAPDAVVTDLWMPGSDGFSLIGGLHAKFPAVGLVVMSGGSPRCSQEASLDQARAAGVSQILLKPIDKEELLAAIQLALHGDRARPVAGP